MIIVDAQAHIWVGGKPASHHRQVASVSKDDLIRDMAAAGVDRVVLVPPSWDHAGNAPSLEAARLHPDKFAVMGEIDLEKPESRSLVEKTKTQPGMLGLRLIFNTPEKRDALKNGGYDWMWETAERAGIPLMMGVPNLVPLIGPIAERYPGLRIVIDHLGVHTAGPKDDAAFPHFPDLLALAKYTNVAIKASGAPGFCSQPYPFPVLHPHLRRVFDAFGPQRMFWGSDITRCPNSLYRQSVTLFTEELPWLTGRDLELVMGRALCDWIGWKL